MASRGRLGRSRSRKGVYELLAVATFSGLFSSEFGCFLFKVDFLQGWFMGNGA